MKKILQIPLLLVALSLTSIPISAHDFEVDGIYYNILNEVEKTVEVTFQGSYYYSSAEYTGVVTIPSLVTYNEADYSVTTIGEDAFYGCTGLTSVTIPNSVTEIGGWAFYGCTGLTSVTIPNSVTSIGYSAFSDCIGLTEVNITDLSAWCKIGFGNLPGNPLCYAGHLKLNGTEITDLVIPDDISEIKAYSFYGCIGLTSVIIPKLTTKISDAAFRGCSGLSSIVVDEGNDAFDSRNNCNAIIETATNTLILGCKNTTIPFSLTKIGDYTFSGCAGMTSITIPNSVISIGSWAFSNCDGLTSITIPNSVKKIGSSAFGSCDNLATINVENGNNVYDSRNNCNAIIETATNTLISGCKNSEIPNSVTSIGEYAFQGCSGLNGNLTLGNSVTSIGKWAFSSCKGLTSVTIPNSVTSIGGLAFIFCDGLTEVNFNAINCTSTGSSETTSAFIGSSCTTLNIGKEVKIIPDYAFRGLSLTEVNYNAKDCSSIGTSAFSSCKTLNIGDEVKTIPDNAFCGHSYLTNITLNNVVTHIGSNAFTNTGWYNNQANGVLYLDNCCLGYKGDAPTENLKIKDKTRFIANDAFYNCSELNSVTIPKSVTYIGESAFYNCGLRAVLSYNMAPPTCVDGAFGGDVNSSYSARLMIPEGTYHDYIVADEWYKFDRIQEMASIEMVEVDNNAIEVARYNIHGHQLNEPTKGINIIKMSDGTTRKEFVK